MRPRKRLAIIAVSGIVLILACCHTYYVAGVSGGDLLWNSNKDEAYLFFEVNRLGYRVSYLEYPFEAFREYFMLARLPDDRNSSMSVWRITSGSVESYTAENISLNFFTPFGDEIYANRDGALWKWSSDHFEPAISDEQVKLGGLNHLYGLSMTNIDGWSTKRELGSQGKEVTYDMTLGGKQVALLVDPGPQNDKISVDLLRLGQVPQRLWNMNQTTRKISKTEYDHFFQKH